MSDLSRKAFLGFFRLQLALALLLFLPAWSLHFWEAWTFWSVFGGGVLCITLYFLKHDPALIERRMAVGPGAEPEKSQKIIQAIGGVLSFAVIIVPGSDHRLRWSSVSPPIVVVANGVVAWALLVVFRVFKENSYTASTVRVEANQQVVSTGPYAWVRHPMYAAGILGFPATPLALGSLWALLPALLLCGMIIIRLLDEERYLSKHLSGYDAYCRTVRYRLIPYLW